MENIEIIQLLLSNPNIDINMKLVLKLIYFYTVLFNLIYEISSHLF